MRDTPTLLEACKKAHKTIVKLAYLAAELSEYDLEQTVNVPFNGDGYAYQTNRYIEAAIAEDKHSHDRLLEALERAELSTAQIRLVADIGRKSAKDKVNWCVGQLEQLGREIRTAIAEAEKGIKT